MTAKRILGFFSIIFIVVILAGIIAVSLFCYNVVKDVSSRIERGAIERIIASESPVYYDDGKTKIGVFFDRVHRKYVHYREIPSIFIKALVAAEDARFFDESFGIDFMAILRALVANIRAGHVVQGGSTLTQQTAKNIFKRERRSYKAKLKELIQAIMLSRRYSKEDILEMYCNQFFVTSFGKGLKIASEYFFSKEPKDLDLVEAAFIAGSVKAPNRYNPFTKRTEKGKKRARTLAKIRKDYVLKRMLQLKFITKAQYLRAIDAPVPFREGKITYRLNVVLDFVRQRLDSEYFRKVLHDQGVDNIATSGISVYTSINASMQRIAANSLRTHLSLLDIMLGGYHLDAQQERFEKMFQKNGVCKGKKDGLPFLVKVSQVCKETKDPRIVVSWKNGGGIIGYQGMKGVAEAWLKWKWGIWARWNKSYLPKFLSHVHRGDIIPVRIVPSHDATNGHILELSWFPELEGAIVVLHDGLIKAMVGGFNNSFFNRAAYAKRQFGSVFKPLVYAAALNLKWNILDVLENRRAVFKFENTVYMPRPDHMPQAKEVSMVWAGAKSENLATVWLLCHLTDRLKLNEFRQVAALLGLTRGPHETYRAYKKRLRDRYGIVVNKKALKGAAFHLSIEDAKADIIFMGHEDTLNNLNWLHLTMPVKGKKIGQKDREDILRFDFIRLSRTNDRMKRACSELNTLFEGMEQGAFPAKTARLQVLLTHFFIKNNSRHESAGYDGKPRIIYCEHRSMLYNAEDIMPLSVESLQGLFPLSAKDVWIDNILTSGAIDNIRDGMVKNYKDLEREDPYSMRVLYRVPDFRMLVNLHYVVMLSKKLGISTHLDPVLSFPLGPDSITLLEAALAYGSMMTGEKTELPSTLSGPTVPVITRIKDRHGEIIWELRPSSSRLLSERTCAMTGEILRKVVEVGTGRGARQKINAILRLRDGESFTVPIPAFGKTGTSNRFTNSSFLGFIPGFDENTGDMNLRHGYVIGCYVGYDDNRPMKTSKVSIYGASGALPIWIETANRIVNTDAYIRHIQPADLVFQPYEALFPPSLRFRDVPVSCLTGLPLPPFSHGNKGEGCEVFADAETFGENWILKRYFEP